MKYTKDRNTKSDALIDNTTAMPYYNYYHKTAFSYNSKGIKVKNFSDSTMRKIDDALMSLKASGVKIKTYKYIRLCHDFIRDYKNYDPNKHTDLMINYATDQARNLYSVLS